MNDLTEARINGERQQFKVGLNALLNCDELWHGKLSHSIVEAAIDQASGHESIVNDKEHFGPELIEKHYRELLRDLLAIGKVSNVIEAWARTEPDQSTRDAELAKQKRVEFPDWLWELCRKASGSDDPEPYIRRILEEEMKKK